MALDGTERVPQDIWAQARAAHAEQDDVRVGAAVRGELAKLGRVLEHLLGDVQPAEAVANLLSLRRVRSPKGRVLRPQAPRGVGLLQLRDARSDVGLERAEAVPLPRTFAGFDVLALFLEGREQALERFRERLDPLDLQLPRDLIEVDAELGELLQLPLGCIEVLIDAAPRLAVLAESSQRGGRDGVDSVGTDELLDVVGVRVARVLGRSARPQRALQLSAGLLQLIPTRTTEGLAESLVGDLGV